MAAHVEGVSPATVQRVWAARGLKPTWSRRSSCPTTRGSRRSWSTSSACTSTPDNAILLCLDEKSSVQALGPHPTFIADDLGPGSDDDPRYQRNGTTTLFAALDVLTGKVIGDCLPRHRHTEFLQFLRTIEKKVPKGLQVRLLRQLRHLERPASPGLRTH